MIPGEVRIFVCTEAVDMRLGFDRLAQIARERVGCEPADGGALFVFVGRAYTRLKLLWFERNGLCLLYKRLHRAVFEVPLGSEGAACVRIDGSALAQLIAGVAREGKSRREMRPAEPTNA